MTQGDLEAVFNRIRQRFDTHMEEDWKMLECVERLARLGFAVETMPLESSIKRIKQVGLKESPWVGMHYINVIEKEYVGGQTAMEVLTKLTTANTTET